MQLMYAKLRFWKFDPVSVNVNTHLYAIFRHVTFEKQKSILAIKKNNTYIPVVAAVMYGGYFGKVTF